MKMLQQGKIQLVGAGPGDPDLLTIKAYKALQQADVVISDRLVAKEILALVKGQVILSHKTCGRADLAQAELDSWGLQALKRGQKVVRLKNGDPFLFGRGGEEVLVYRQAGFEVEVIPGISSSMAAATSALIPVTMRDHADQFLVCTGHGKQDRFPELPEYCSHRTTVFLMAIGRIRGLVRELRAIGYPEDLPVAIIEKATMSDSRTFRTTLTKVADVVAKYNIQPPATVVVGQVVNALRSDSDYEISYEPLVEVPQPEYFTNNTLKRKMTTLSKQRHLKISFPRSFFPNRSLMFCVVILPMYFLILFSVAASALSTTSEYVL